MSTSRPRLISYSTTQAPDGGEVDYWRQARRDAYVSARSDPVDIDFGGEIRLGEYADFRLSTKRAQAEVVRRSKSDIAQSSDDLDCLYFLFQLRGRLLVEQAGRSALATPGSLVIYAGATPFTLRAKNYYEQVVLELPADEAFALSGVNRSDDLLAQTFTCDGAMGVVAAFFVNLARRQEEDPLGAHRLEPHALTLGASLISQIAAGKGEEPRPGRRDEVLAFMRAHLADPGLDPERIAEGLHISRRTLFRVFEGTGASAMASLRSFRLERARHLLQAQPEKSIAAIAREAGFSSPVQFYRTFGLTVGMTPGEYRAQLSGGSADTDQKEES